MKDEVQRTLWLLAIWLLAGALVSTPADAQATCPGNEDERIPGQVILKLDNDSENQVTVESLLVQYGLSLVDALPDWQLFHVSVPVGPGEDPDLATEAIMAALQDDASGVDDVEPLLAMEAPEGVQLSIPDIDNAITLDLFEGQPAGSAIGVGPAQARYTGRGVVVAVIDTGIALDHPLIAEALLGAGADFVDGVGTAAAQANGQDDDGDGLVDESLHHATFVAGLIRMVAPDVRILPVRSLDDEGNGSSFNLAEGILYAIANGADVINLSEVSLHVSRSLEQAMEAARDAGVVIVAAAGNHGLPAVDESLADGCASQPASMNEAIAVASVDGAGVRAIFSNYGPDVDLSAPGIDLLSSFGPAGFARWDGTSFSAPLVSGAIALLLEKYPGLSPDDVRSLLAQTAQADANPPELDGLMGAGILDLDALTAALFSDRTSLRLSRTPTGTVLSWSPVLDATLYDVARGRRIELSEYEPDEGTELVDLGPLVCLADDLAATDTPTVPDDEIPAPGDVFFYVFRDDAPAAGGGGSYGSSDGNPRVALLADCSTETL